MVMCTYMQAGTQPDLTCLQDGRSHGNNAWAAFDDLAAQRSSRLNSDEPAQRPQAGPNQFDQQATPSSAPSDEEGGGWAAFAADPPAFPSVGPAFAGDPPAFATDASSARQAGHEPDSHTQASSGDNWAAFDDPDAGQHQAAPTGSSRPEASEPQGTNPSDEKPLPHAEFGECNFWRTHPLALVDNVD